MLNKAMQFNPDVVLPDMEDSVPPSEKENARRVIAKMLPVLATRSHVWRVMPRVNALESEHCVADLETITSKSLCATIWGVSIGKVSSVDDIRELDKMLENAEKRACVTPKTLRVCTSAPYSSLSIYLFIHVITNTR